MLDRASVFIELLTGGLGPIEDTRRVDVSRDVPTGLESDVAAVLLVPGLRIGERLLRLVERRDALFDRTDKHRAIPQSWQVEVLGEARPEVLRWDVARVGRPDSKG